MDDRSQKILDSLPQRSGRSRLSPYRELIHELRRRRRTYREIARILAEKCQCRVSISTLYDFVRLRKRADRVPAHHRAEEEAASQSGGSGGGIKQKTTVAGGETARAEADDVQQRIDALKRRPATAEVHPVQFHYDPNKPLNLPNLDRKNRNEN